MYELLNPRRRENPLARDIILGVSLLLFVIFTSVLIGIQMGEVRLNAWGEWIGAFVAALALIGSIYAIILQSRGGEATNWNIASERLGQQYLYAQSNAKLSKILLENPDVENKNLLTYEDVYLNPQEELFISNLFLSFEQIFIASKSLSGESRRVWRIYLFNQLNKPTLRALFVKDSINAKDYHQEFFRFVRGKKIRTHKFFKNSIESGKLRRKRFVIHPIHYQSFSSENKKELIIENKIKEIKAEPVKYSDIDFWIEIYKDKYVLKQMYPLPVYDDESIWKHLQERNYYTVWQEKERIGGFNLKFTNELIVDIGIVVKIEFRRQKLGKQILRIAERVAKSEGVKTVRANIYHDNIPAKSLFCKNGYRKFEWFEKNI